MSRVKPSYKVTDTCVGMMYWQIPFISHMGHGSDINYKALHQTLDDVMFISEPFPGKSAFYSFYKLFFSSLLF